MWEKTHKDNPTSVSHFSFNRKCVRDSENNEKKSKDHVSCKMVVVFFVWGEGGPGWLGAVLL